MYKLIKSHTTNNISCIQYEIENVITSIPLATANTDYQAYLKWLDEGGVVLPADEPNR